MKKYYVYPILFFLVITSCNKNEFSDGGIQEEQKLILSPEEIISISFHDPQELSESAVMELVKDFPLTLGPDAKSTFEGAAVKVSRKFYFSENGTFSSAKKISTKSSGELSLPIYDVDITKGDIKMKAYVSADERFPSVLAYVPAADTKTKFDILEHPMYAYSLDMATKKIQFYDKLKDSLREKTLDKLSANTGKKISYDAAFSELKKFIKSEANLQTKDGTGGGGMLLTFPTTVINKIGPFTTMRWSQSGWFDSPYNDKMPLSDICGTGSEKAPAGCVTVAVAQILGHIKPSLTLPYYTTSGSFALDWNLFNVSPDLNFVLSPWDAGFSEMGSLMRWVADGLGSTQTCTGNNVQTSASSTTAINFLRNHVNINNLVNFSTQQIKTSLDALKIVYASGERLAANNGRIGHAWVIDGYAVCRKGTVNGNNGSNDIVNKYDMYLHANMGWGASSGSGWYLVNNDWSIAFDTGDGAPNPGDVDRINYRFNLKNATHAGAK